ncbi:hypothetical protein HYU14_00525 [Candidatus Woesearchaeota archaeon]|nr:hypothetical protein [Candidatus Woesearchaeota archaeon]
MEKEKIGLVEKIMFIITLFAIILQIFPPKTAKDQQNSLIYFLAILGYVSFLYGSVWISNKVKFYINQVNKNKKDIEDIKDKMDEEKRLYEIEKRISILEAFRRNRKAFAIDPKWVFMGILIVLFYLYLRSLGFFK